ncbi:MAG TPA: class I SAM-dependent RNA methyltransferase [Ktedonobacteraceae bacterium]
MIREEPLITYHTVTLGALTRAGDALAEIVEQDEAGQQHTRTLHVPAGLPGERVTIAVEAPTPPPKRRTRYWKARPPRVWITEIHQASPLRIQASCPVFGVCGGCQLQHMHYEAQLEWKRSVVQGLLHEIGGFANPPLCETVPCDIPWHYRNHMRFSVNRSGQPGLTARGTHRVLPLESCPIAHEQINRALGVLSNAPNERPQVLIRCGAATGQVLLQPHPHPNIALQLAEAGLDLRSETMDEILGGEMFRIRPSSFFQTNTAQAEKMAQMVLDGLALAPARGATAFQSEPQTTVETRSGTPGGRQASTQHQNVREHPRTIVDAYCGVGTFALLLARHVDNVIAIEESASAIKDARWNLREVSNVAILKGKVEDLLPTLECHVDGLVIDPPRAGCQQAVLDALVQHPADRIVYVSCDPATLARDLHILCHLHPTYRLQSVQPLDMFPQTAHIECVAVLERIEQ